MDLLKKLMDRSDGHSQAAIAGTLERLLKDAKDEGKTLQALIASAATRANEIPQVHASLDDAGRRAASVTDQLESLSTRVENLENIQRQIQALENRVVSVEGGVQKAEERLQQTLARRLRSRNIRKLFSSWCRWGMEYSPRSRD
jgi:predicted  nucleic acid-binding Zn-ribbon protein